MRYAIFPSQLASTGFKSACFNVSYCRIEHGFSAICESQSGEVWLILHVRNRSYRWVGRVTGAGPSEWNRPRMQASEPHSPFSVHAASPRDDAVVRRQLK